jgi:hypothetical protein
MAVGRSLLMDASCHPAWSSRAPFLSRQFSASRVANLIGSLQVAKAKTNLRLEKDTRAIPAEVPAQQTLEIQWGELHRPKNAK